MRRIAKTSNPKSLRVAAAQMVFAGSIDGNLEKIEAAASEAATQGADAVLFPECALTGYAFDFSTLNATTLREALHAVAGVAARLGIHILIGSPIFAEQRLYNALLVFNRSGKLIHTYAKCQLVDSDRRWFTPGNGLSLFKLDGVPATAMICHERRYPELVRLPAMAGARIVFHANAGMDALAVSRSKRRGRDGMPARAFENAIYYVFANSVGEQGNAKWSAGDSKIVGPDGSVLQLANNHDAQVLVESLDLAQATRKYALDSLRHPRFLASHWRRMLPEMRRRIRETDQMFRRWFESSCRNSV